MHLVKNTRSKKYCIMSDYELVTGRPGSGKPRGKLVVRTGRWSLEDQINLARRIQRKHWSDPEAETMCTRPMRTSSGAIRICGRALKDRKDGFNRERCGSCSTDLVIPEYVGVPPIHKHTLYETKASSNLIQETCSVGTTADLSDCSSYALPTEDTGTQTITRQLRIVHQAPITIEPTMSEHVEACWDMSYAKNTRWNMKSGIKKGLQYLHLSMNSTKRDFLEATVDLDHVYNVFVSKKNTCNMLSAFRTMLRYFDKPERSERLQKLWDVDHPRKPVPLTDERRQLITTLAKHLHVDMSMDPGQRLLKAMQAKVMQFEPTTTAERARTFDQLLALWMPLARAGSGRFRFCKEKPSEEAWKHIEKNLVVVDRNGEIEGLFFGDIKYSKTKRTHYYKKRIWLDSEGIDTLDMGQHVIPCHMAFSFQAWRRKVYSLLKDQLAENGKMGRVFKRVPEWPLEFFGVPKITSLDSRMIFRNGCPKVDEFFIKKIMNHCRQVDEHFYVKRELLDGPFSASQ